MAQQWVAGYRTAVLSPYEQARLVELRTFADQTVREPLFLAGGGERIRVRLSNRFGRNPLRIGAARVAVQAKADAIVLETDRALLFDGRSEVTIPPGGEVVSDDVPLAVEAKTLLALSLYLPDGSEPATYSHMPMENAFIAPGNQTESTELDASETAEARVYVTGVDVLAPEGTPVAVAFGDSWFEGTGTTVGGNARSVDALNERLARGWVVNLGISGNRLLTDEIGEHALSRLDRDVLSVPGATHVLLNFGINDIGLPGMLGEPAATAPGLIAGFTELAARIHAADLRVLAATIGPFGGAIYEGISTPDGLRVRREVNDWIRGTHVFDGIFDVARAVEDPGNPDHIRPDLDAGDGMHLNDPGAALMAATVNLSDLW
ncbi:GDSL-type esterase/lipase family protein [Actinomadura rupiterrae]|uniref:GDSL-type esterase/lipase family protein n=1 Tax=Actinomadura rupiterrae TaxID=559627 RepID=UPI0020A2570C|nr:GDSL-type esterase/lipase family protein [Actinomadura rupiterrae]MCP2340428.1 lysophospholipase L1-like esterase [Actinomadura rupiterrae]